MGSPRSPASPTADLRELLAAGEQILAAAGADASARARQVANLATRAAKGRTGSTQTLRERCAAGRGDRP